MSQQDLAESAGVTRQTINALENGRYNPSLLLAYKITRILNKATYGEDSDSYLSIEDKIGRASCRERVCQYV